MAGRSGIFLQDDRGRAQACRRGGDRHAAGATDYDARRDHLKLECLQPIGAFKIRGAYNAVRLLPEDQRRAGVWTVSAGDAAQGVALAARKAGIPCKVLVMDTAPAAKLDSVRRLGGEIVQLPDDQCWKALSDRAHPAMSGTFVHPVRRRRIYRRKCFGWIRNSGRSARR